MRGVSSEQQAQRLAAMKKMAEDIANGNGPLDRVERDSVKSKEAGQP